MVCAGSLPFMDDSGRYRHLYQYHSRSKLSVCCLPVALESDPLNEVHSAAASNHLIGTFPCRQQINLCNDVHFPAGKAA